MGGIGTKMIIAKRKMKYLSIMYCDSENGPCKLFADTASHERKMLVMSM